jgi:hypothetical protein
LSNESSLRKVDHAAIRTNQAAIIVSLLVAFVADVFWLVGLVGALMLIGTALGTQAFRWLYVGVLRRIGWVQPDLIPDHPEPHRFAQGLGGAVLGTATLALLLGASTIGWALVWMVVLLAGLNLFLGFCAGCFVYYWLARWRIPGFSHSPPANGFPGLRPPRA